MLVPPVCNVQWAVCDKSFHALGSQWSSKLNDESVL